MTPDRIASQCSDGGHSACSWFTSAIAVTWSDAMRDHLKGKIHALVTALYRTPPSPNPPNASPD